MSERIKRIVKTTHFLLTGMLLLNLFVFLLSGTSLSAGICWWLKIAVFASGVVAALFHLKPLSRVSFYFSYFLITPVLSFLAWLVDGIFGAITIGFFFFWMIPYEAKVRTDDLIVYKPFSGVIGGHESYELYEKTFLFETRIGKFDITDVNLETESITLKNNRLTFLNSGKVVKIE